MSTRRKVGDVVWKAKGAGFVRQGSWAVIVDDGESDIPPCLGMNGCTDPDCREWPTLWGLPGSTREEAEGAMRREEYLGAAYHVSECEMEGGDGMMQPTFDAGGYPTEETLERIATWRLEEERNLDAFLDFIKECWHFWHEGFAPMVVKGGEIRWYLATGGWSGNEEVIGALHRNFVFWGLAWESSSRGGGHQFSISENIAKTWRPR